MIANTPRFGSSLYSHGGAVFAVDSTVDVLQTVFRNNRASGAGGAIRMTGRQDRTLTIVNSTFNNNIANAGGGGAIYSQGASVIVSGSRFTSNEGFRGVGGAIYVISTSFPNVNDSISLVVSGSSFTDNTGGAIQ